MEEPFRYRTQMVVALLQCVLIVGGTLLVGVTVKGMENVWASQARSSIPAWLGFIRFFGLSLLLIPGAWVGLTIAGERSSLWWMTSRVSLISGVLVLAVLAVLFGYAMMVASLLP